MSQLRKILLTMSLLFGVTSTAFSGAYVHNYSDWRRLSAVEKNAYVMGLMDSHWVNFSEDKDNLAIYHGLRACIERIKLTPDMIAEEISMYYKTHSENWDYSPMAVFFHSVIRGICLDHVNEMRENFDLPEWARTD